MRRSDKQWTWDVKPFSATPTGRQMPAADHPPRVTNPPETAASVRPLTQPRLRLRSRRRVASLMKSHIRRIFFICMVVVLRID